MGIEDFGNKNERKKVWAVPGLEKYHGQKIFLSEAITREALSELDSIVGKQPFFLYMSHYVIHTPIMADDRYRDNYLDMGLDSVEAAYASLVEGIDKILGDIMDYIDSKDIVDNTIILFMSDNGGLSALAVTEKSILIINLCQVVKALCMKEELESR